MLKRLIVMTIMCLSLLGCSSLNSGSQNSGKNVVTYMLYEGQKLKVYEAPYTDKYEDGVAYYDGEIYKEYKMGFELSEYSDIAFQVAMDNVKDYERNNPTAKDILYNFYPNGSIMVVSSYKNQKLHGLQTWFDLDGNISSTKNFKKGLLGGESIDYYPSGRIYSKAIFSEGRLDGSLKTYSESGVLINEYFDSSQELDWGY